MWPGRACAVLAAVVLGAAAAPAGADVICVDPGDPDCVTSEEAFATAQDGDTIVLGAVEVDTPLSSAHRIEVAGAGEGVTKLGALELGHARAVVADLRLASLDLAGEGRALRVVGEAVLRGGARLRASLVEGTVRLAGQDADAQLDSVLVRADGQVALAACGGSLLARHVTITGTADGAASACEGATLELREAIVAGEFTAPLEGTVQGDAILGGPELVDAGGRLPAGSPLIDAGSTESLAVGEWPEDRGRLPRVADGDGDGVAERDPGAFERQPAALPLPGGNLLLDPGAEAGGAWAFSAGFTRERYGRFPLPSLPAAAALGAGAAFFIGGTSATGSATQRIDVGGAALEIDRGTATVTLSGLLGGLLDDPDAGSLEATFLDPAGAPISTVALPTPTAAERRNVTMLLPRTRTDAVPGLTRAIDVTMRAIRADGTVNDAYFDNLALTVTAPGAPPPPGPNDPPFAPFAGVRSLTGLATVNRKKRHVALRLVCADGTVGGCSAVITMVTRLKHGGRGEFIGKTEVQIRPGGNRRAVVPLNGRARRIIRERRRVRMLVYIAARDGQQLIRRSTIPLTVQWPKAPKKPKTPRR